LGIAQKQGIKRSDKSILDQSYLEKLR